VTPPAGKDGGNDGNVFLDGGVDGSGKDGSVDSGPPPIFIEGNAWSSSGCCRNDGDGGCAGFCIGYTIGQCGNSDPYGGACENYDASGPSQCGHDPRTTTYRCMHEYCARGCVPGGGAPDYGWIPYFQCTDSGACGPPL
jgi:hypothetical protein